MYWFAVFQGSCLLFMRNGLTIFAILYTLGNILSLARLVIALWVRERGEGREREEREGGRGRGMD